MGFIYKVLTLLLVYIVVEIKCQNIFSGLQGIDSLPVIGACDRIASRGAMNCMENFLPSRTLSGLSNGRANSGVCCSYSKYRACIAGLHDGLRIAMEREKCPRSYSTRIIKSLGDSLVGAPLKTMCGSSETSKCKSPGNKKRNNRNSTRRPIRDDESSAPSQSARGQNPKRKTSSENPTSFLEPAIQPFRDIFEQNPKRRTGSGESTSIFDPVLNPVRNMFGQNGRRRGGSDESTSVFDPILEPVRGIFGQSSTRKRGSDDSTSILDPVLNPVRDVFGRFPTL